MKFMKISGLLPFLFLLFPNSLWAGDSPEVIYQVWVEASRAGDIDRLLAVSSAAKVKEFHQEFSSPEKKEEIRKLMKVMAPKSYEVKKTEVSPDGNKASLFVDAIAMDFFSLNDPKAKPERETMEVRLVKEGGEWKVDKQCAGKDGCGKEPDWVGTSWGKVNGLSGGATLKIQKGAPSPFKDVKVKGQPFVVSLVFNLPEGASTLSYFLHRSPSFAEFFTWVDGEKITPLAIFEDFPPVLKEESGKGELKTLEEGVSYSQNRLFKGQGTLSLLFDLPKNAKSQKELHLMVTYGEQQYPFEIR